MRVDSTKTIDQEAGKSEDHVPVALGNLNGKMHIFLLLLISGLVFFICAYITSTETPTGDEPHYLVISQTLLLYHSLDVNLDYTHNDYKVFYGGSLGGYQHTSLNKWGQPLPLHSIGGPVLWLLPFALAGHLGTLFFMSFLSVLIILNIYLLLVSLGIRRNYALFTSLAITLASPIWIFSHRDFIEPIGAFLCIYIIRVIFRERLRAWDLLLSSAALGALPWIHIRFALFEVILCCFLLARVYQDFRFQRISMYIYALLPVAGMFLLFEGYNLFVWGSLNPAVNQASSGEVPFDVAPWRGLLGLFYDQEYGLLLTFPIFLFLLAGIVVALKKELLRFNLLMLLLIVPYLIIVASFHNWDGAISPPDRFLTVLVPPLAFYLALALQEARSRIINGLFLLCMVVGMLYEGVSMSIGGGWMDWRDGHASPLPKLSQALHLPLTGTMPSVFGSDQGPLFAAWFLITGALTLAIFLLARRQPRESRT